MIHFLAACAVIVATTVSSSAQTVAPIDTLFRALGLPDIIEIMREEGIAYGEELQADLLGGRSAPQWHVIIEDIYDLERMQRTVRNRLDVELAAQNLAPMIDFFESEQGRKIVALEVSARRALLDKSVEAASKTALAAMKADNDPRLDLLKEFAEVGDLVEYNVVGAMNSNFAFYNGLARGGAFAEAMTESEILSDIWGQEDAIRTDTEDWLYSYLALAYGPLSDDELRAYTGFFKTPAGAVLNRAIFAAFDEMFSAVSLALGRGAGNFLSGEEL